MRNFIASLQRLKIKIEAQNKNLLITDRIIFKFYNMERVETLCNLLSEKLQKKATIAELLTTVKMIESELLHLQKITPPVASNTSTTAINIAKQITPERPEGIKLEKQEEEKIVEVLQIDEAEMEAELDEIKRNVEDRTKLSYQNKPPVLFDAIDDVPTLAGRQNAGVSQYLNIKEIHETLPTNSNVSLNERLKQTGNELSEKLQETPVKDLKKAIGINDRFKFLSELFRGDEAMYERSIKTINSYAIYPEAEYWIRRELKLKLGWDDKNETVKQFDQLVRRRFS